MTPRVNHLPPEMKIVYSKERAKMVFGQEMIPCPKCQSYALIFQTPIKIGLTGKETPAQLLGKWAKSHMTGRSELEGPVFIMCRNCFHKGPALDCTGRTSQDVGKDPLVAAEVKRLWNFQIS